MSFQSAPVVVQIGRTNATAALSILTRPVGAGRAGRGDQRVAAKRPALLEVRRQYDGPSAGAAGLVEGTIRIFTALLGMIAGQLAGATQTAELLAADGTQTAFQTNIPYVAFSNNNWIVRKSSDRAGAITGTVTKTAGSATLAGSGTAFDTECHVGETILVGTEYRTITAIASATSLTVSFAYVTTAAGATAYGVVEGFTGLTGTLAVTSGSSAVTGTSTKFTKEVTAGDNIVIAGNTYTVASVNSDTSLTLLGSVSATNAVARGFGPSAIFLTRNTSATDANDFTVTSGIGGMTIITLPAAPVAGSRFQVWFVTPVEVLADGVHVFDRATIQGGDVYWGVGTGDGTTYDFSACQASVEPAHTI